ncbi:UDP-galactopyranose mutase [Veillonella criceti]|uniref:UDP-galactopyranose mutase n=1 Tax=Veillonella criceti TaxID=103891 RepID=A0A380NMY7_9FIRM|nr:UDP-galactopyranose mutase [Veillonella criceti]SUP44764.1 UDP-galactopyranose mutase [Veillonella criceti]
MYDYLIVGAGLYGAVMAHELKNLNKKILVIDRREQIGGNVYTKEINGIQVHQYGAHIFNTHSTEVWEYVQQFAKFNRFTNSPIANYKGEIFSLPFSMYTFNKMWGVIKPEEAKVIIEKQKKESGIIEPQNLEEQAISLVGKDIYEKLIKGYTEKQWGRACKDLPSFIIKRLPVRFIYDNNYFNSPYQGIPIGGYTNMVANMLKDIEIELGVDYIKNRQVYSKMAKNIIYTGPIDEYFDYKVGNLEYRSVRFETEVLDISNFQGNAVVNYTDAETPWTRIIEHKWFEFGKDQSGKDIEGTVISREYSSEWSRGDEPYYPVNDERNNLLYKKYVELAKQESNVHFGGRLAEYKYYNMDAVIATALSSVKKVL